MKQQWEAGDFKLVERGMLDPKVKRKRELAELFGMDEEDSINKVISDNKRGNKFHDERGRFTSTSASMTYEEWKNRNNTPEVILTTEDGKKIMSDGTVQDAEGNLIGTVDVNNPEGGIKPIQPETYGYGWKPPAGTVIGERGIGAADMGNNAPISLAGFGVIETVTDNLNFDNTQELAFATNLDKILQRFKVKSANTLIFGKLAYGVMGQNNYAINNYQGQLIADQTITIDLSQSDTARKMYREDREKMKAGNLPYNAASYAKDESGIMGTAAVHEAAHAMFTEYTVVKPTSEWIDQNKPDQGTLAWKRTVDGAAQNGWQGPSEYAKTNYGEMFAESVAMYGETGSTGSQTVDSFITRVVDR